MTRLCSWFLTRLICSADPFHYLCPSRYNRSYHCCYYCHDQTHCLNRQDPQALCNTPIGNLVMLHDEELGHPQADVQHRQQDVFHRFDSSGAASRYRSMSLGGAGALPASVSKHEAPLPPSPLPHSCSLKPQRSVPQPAPANNDTSAPRWPVGGAGQQMHSGAQDTYGAWHGVGQRCPIPT